MHTGFVTHCLSICRSFFLYFIFVVVVVVFNRDREHSTDPCFHLFAIYFLANEFDFFFCSFILSLFALCSRLIDCIQFCNDVHSSHIFINKFEMIEKAHPKPICYNLFNFRTTSILLLFNQTKRFHAAVQFFFSSFFFFSVQF